ncbi:acyltransferase family protein [Granulicella arctica]|uniref:Peptidoglycan/LPS O-acetylase OafA/YrhL n=1 Tax=Granulicella arctica TaxID=940613 RepID=A0A7Y9PGF4_9BACT|nr:acyltransferase [Granulicella arctica]NYF79259.1 peptidoglycan/LPS O-acetylase OafA/YrhL [Granulicella arctica]
MKQRHIPALDGLRGVAVLMVFVYHYGGGTHSSNRVMQLFGFFNKGGWVGVTLFFILSGFLITGILWDSYDDPHWWRNFYMRRTLRIFPLYFGTLLLVLLAAAAVGTFLPALKMIWVPFLFLQNIPPLIDNINRLPSPFPLFHFWSLAVEEQFYLIWPFLLVLQKTRRRAQLLCLTVFLLACAFRICLWQFAPNPDYVEFILTRAGELAAGGWLAIAYRGPEWPRVERFAPATAMLGGAGFLFAGLHCHSFESTSSWMMELGLPGITLCLASILVLAIRPGLLQRCFSGAWLRWIGSISFGIYVFHVLLAKVFHFLTHQLAGNRGPMVQNAVFFVIAAIGSVVAAWLSFHFYEKRFLRIKKRFTPISESPLVASQSSD